jgi:hypothetical protein
MGPEASGVQENHDLELEELHQALHELCQPLTALQCRLELGLAVGGPELRAAVDDSLEETRRIFTAVARLRSWLCAHEDAVAPPDAVFQAASPGRPEAAR